MSSSSTLFDGSERRNALVLCNNNDDNDADVNDADDDKFDDTSFSKSPIVSDHPAKDDDDGDDGEVWPAPESPNLVRMESPIQIRSTSNGIGSGNGRNPLTDFNLIENPAAGDLRYTNYQSLGQFYKTS